MALQKAILKEKNRNNSSELWKALGSLGMKSGKVNQSKIALKNDSAIQCVQIFSTISTLI